MICALVTGVQTCALPILMENVLFKISFPAEFHAQTAVECAMKLHREVAPKLDQVDRIVIETQEAGARIIDKTGPLANYADRVHKSERRRVGQEGTRTCRSRCSPFT